MCYLNQGHFYNLTYIVFVEPAATLSESYRAMQRAHCSAVLITPGVSPQDWHTIPTLGWLPHSINYDETHSSQPMIANPKYNPNSITGKVL